MPKRILARKHLGDVWAEHEVARRVCVARAVGEVEAVAVVVADKGTITADVLDDHGVHRCKRGHGDLQVSAKPGAILPIQRVKQATAQAADREKSFDHGLFIPSHFVGNNQGRIIEHFHLSRQFGKIFQRCANDAGTA